MCLLWIVFKKYGSRLSVIFRWWVLWVRMSFKRLVLSIVNNVNIVNEVNIVNDVNIVNGVNM